MVKKSPSIRKEDGDKDRTRTFYINYIFEKDSLQILYTKTADLYQDIMMFNLKNGSGVAFTFNGLAKWLIKRNYDFATYYSGSKANISMSNRIANRRDSIQRCIDDLVSCGLISLEGTRKAERNNLLTQVYKFTIPGNIISMLLELPRLTDPSVIDRLIYNIMSSIGAHLLNHHSFIVKFASDIFFKSAKIEECSDAIIDRLRYLLHTHDIFNSQDLDRFLEVVLYFMISWRELSPLFFENVFKKALLKLDEEARSIILLHEKIQVENQIRQIFPPQDWERMWFHNIHDHTKLVLFGKCTKCSEGYPFVVPLIDYFGTFTDQKVHMKCTKCNCDNSLCVILFEPFQNLPPPWDMRNQRNNQATINGVTG